MSRLPGASNATLDDAKITQYLLDASHSPEAAAKERFFTSFGFSPADWHALKNALLDHPQNNQVTGQTSNAYGKKYVVSCSLLTPDGRNPCIVTVWIIEPPEPQPKFITAYPEP